jgi:gas vesicle protein
MSKFLTGAAIGLVIGLLIAPEKGEDLRNDIVDTADKWKERLNRLRGKANANLDDLRGLLDHEIDGLSEDLKHRILTILDDATDMAYQAKPIY